MNTSATTQVQKDTNFYWDELFSEECFCGKNKKSKMSFCYSCYRSLPRSMQRDLYRRMGDGYEEAYDDAVTWLL